MNNLPLARSLALAHSDSGAGVYFSLCADVNVGDLLV